MIASLLRLPPVARAVICMVGTTLLFSTMDAIGKGLTERHDAFQVVWARYASQCFWAVLILSPRLPGLLRTDRIGLQLLRSACLFGATTGFFVGFSVLPLATTAAIFQVSPFLITLLAFFLLGEKVGPRRWAGVAVGFCGALLIIRPGSDVFTAFAFVPLLGAASYAGYMIATRIAGSGESPWTSFLYTALIGTLAASCIVPFVWTTPTMADALILGTFGILGGCGHFLLILALRLAPASVIAPFTYLTLCFNTLWGFLFFGERPDGWTLAGALVIAGAGLYVLHRERLAKQRPA